MPVEDFFFGGHIFFAFLDQNADLVTMCIVKEG